MKFQVIFTFDSEYEGYVAEVPELPGCVSQGKTLDEAIENIKDAIKGYLHVKAKHGKPYTPQESQTFIGEVVDNFFNVDAQAACRRLPQRTQRTLRKEKITN